jgi:cell division protein FtsB
MRALKYLISLWVVIIVYSLLSLFAGARGLSAYNQLRRERDKQRTNLEGLKNINQRLEGDKDALLYDSDTITAYARELGYGTDAERLVRIVGLSGARNQHYTAGQVITPSKQVYLSNQAIRIISLFAGLVVLGGLCLARLMGEHPPSQ